MTNIYIINVPTNFILEHLQQKIVGYEDTKRIIYFGHSFDPNNITIDDIDRIKEITRHENEKSKDEFVAFSEILKRLG